MPNLHSHAFQRALAGLSETFSGNGDDFWTWRRQMYDLVPRLDPHHLQAIAEQLYLEMLKAGYTAVAEFHYLHHDRNGEPYGDTATLSNAVLQAAASTGIALTHLPVLYMSSGFDGGKPGAAQQRFSFGDVSGFLELVQRLQSTASGNPQLSVGIAPHSLRAVPLPALRELADGFSQLGAGPVHIHIAEQEQEVKDCLAHTGRRPVELLCEQLPVDQSWCLVHATHISAGECATLAQTRAVAGLCPSTEANLGDGLFPLAQWQRAAGRLGIGSDSNTSVSPVEELRWLEYGQRLQRQQRNIYATPEDPHVGARLWRDACRGGAQALGRECGRLAIGARADLLVLDSDHPQLLGREDDALLDSFIFSGNSNPIRQVISGGQWLIQDGRHTREEAIREKFARTVEELR
jgi:formimidoylglutamate deiminase